MKITYDFSKCMMDGIKCYLYSQEIPCLYTDIPDDCQAVWFATICEKKKKAWFISIRQIVNSNKFELRAASAKPEAILLFGEYIIQSDRFSGFILSRALELHDEDLSKKLKNYSDLNAGIDALIKEIEAIEDSEIEILDLRNVPFWAEFFSAEAPELAEFLAETRENISVSDETNDIPF